MPWTVPAFETRLLAPVLWNLRRVIKRDAAAALAYFNAGASLPDFVRVGKARRVNETESPLCLVIPRGSDLAEDADAARIEQRHGAEIEVSLLGPDPDKLTDLREIYLTAVHSVVTTVEEADLASEADLPTSMRGAKRGPMFWGITGITRRDFIIKEGQYLQRAVLNFSCGFFEEKN